MTDLDRATLLELWRLMTRIRQFEDRVHADVLADRFEGYVHCYAGEEAVAVGVIPLLRADDWLTSTYRNHGHAIARGVPFEAIAGEIHGRATGVTGGKGGSMHVADQALGMIGGMGIVAAGLPIAAGAAFASAYRGEDRVAVAFFGDGAVHQGAFHEALDFASLFQVPAIFVCENNLYAETTATDYHLLSGSVAEMANTYRMPGVRVDGMDVFAVRDVAAAAINRARKGGGPTLIEAMTYRYYGQYEGDKQTYKPPFEVERYRAADPLPRFRRATETRVRADELDAIDAEVAREVAAAFVAAEAAPWPDPAMLTADVYASWKEAR
jgi:acetoin:2,6-dichlorophenolindophenol oxidoreductase subunit alpha